MQEAQRAVQWSRWIVLSFLAIGTVLFVVWLFHEPVFPISFALVRVENKPGEDPAAYRRTQLAIIKSSHILKAALSTPEVRNLAILHKDDPVQWLQQALVATYLDDTELLRVGVREGDYHERVILTNAVVDAFVTSSIDHWKMRQSNRLKDLEQKLFAIHDKLKKEREKIHQRHPRVVLTRAGARSPLDQLEFDDLAGLRKELRQLQLAKISAQARLNKLKGSDGEQEALARLTEVAVLEEKERLLKEAIKPKRQIVDELSAMEEEVESELLGIAAIESVCKRLSEERELAEAEFKTVTKTPVTIFQRAELSTGQ
jgi:hypothetical protein